MPCEGVKQVHQDVTTIMAAGAGGAVLRGEQGQQVIEAELLLAGWLMSRLLLLLLLQKKWSLQVGLVDWQ